MQSVPQNLIGNVPIKKGRVIHHLREKKREMSNKRITEMYIKQIIELKRRGKSQRQISELLGIHRKTLKDYLSVYEGAGVPETGCQEEEDLMIFSLSCSLPSFLPSYFATY